MDLQKYAGHPEELGQQQHPASHMKVAQILHQLGYSLQSNQNRGGKADHPDRDAQFRHINLTVKRCLSKGSPSFRLNEKKGLVWNYHNGGQLVSYL